MKVRNVLSAVAVLVALAGCPANGDRYAVVNDSDVDLRVVGCVGCDDGQRLRPGDTIHIRQTARRLRFLTVDGAAYGCVTFQNGEPQDDEEELLVSRFSISNFDAASAARCRAE